LIAGNLATTVSISVSKFNFACDRVEHLFGRYEALVNPLERLGIAKNKRVAKKVTQQ
jgi:hypothetical protein